MLWRKIHEAAIPFFHDTLADLTAKPLVDGISVPRDVRFTKKTFLAEPIRTVFEPHQQYLAGREPNAAVETNYLAI